MSNLAKPSLSRYRLSKLFFYILLILLPFQTRKIIFTSQSYYYGYHVFYNDIYLYLTDLIVFGLIVAWLWENLPPLHLPLIKGEKREGVFRGIVTRISQDRIYWFLGVFWLILATSLIFSRETFLGLYGLAKITEFILVFAYVRESISFSTPSASPPYQGGEREGVRTFWLILATSWFQSLLGIYQYLSQSSFGLKIFGEEFLRPGISGIAEFVSHGVANPVFYKFFPYLSPISDGLTYNLRAYGTFPQSNVLAGFLFVGILVNLYLLYTLPHSAPPGQTTPGVSREKSQGKGICGKWVLSLSLFLITTGMVVTFSRFAWGVSAIAILAWVFLIFWRVRRPILGAMKTGSRIIPDRQTKAEYFPARVALIVIVLLVSLGANLFFFSQQIRDRLQEGGRVGSRAYFAQESLSDRSFYNRIATRMVLKNPVFGVGVRNFVVNMSDYAKERLLPYLHQPVHNIYLLIAAESGVLALLVFLLVLYYIVRRAWRQPRDEVLRFTLLLMFFGILGLGFFDHYFWTIQQGSLVFWVSLGFLATKNPAP